MCQSSVFRSEDEVVPEVVKAILNIPNNTHVMVRFTSILLLGELCEWIELHQACLDPVLDFLVASLPRDGLAIASATALQNICTTCNQLMPMHVSMLLHLLQQVIFVPF